MPLVTENIKKNADKCLTCAIIKLKNIEKKGAFKEIGKALDLYDEASAALQGVIMASCNMCPFRENFVVIYGVKPYEHLIDKKKEKKNYLKPKTT